MGGRRAQTAFLTEFQAGLTRGRGKVRNVGEGGLFVGTASLPDVGDTVHLRFSGPGGATVAVSGLVWWTTAGAPPGRHRRPGFGLCLLEASSSYGQMLESLVP